ncbi:UNKNOWN [Stylonychia lemnae]|uniref:Uncharacterized protein n=1 Tax=Stylonychia lemnae TaxID=5949 RepID=A0A078AB33_STYLE|nr:UNKNOWN [Stylonychia lemnae]|eukprot:CDW77998.1 UNKNOWN [Stylonychia lemnae]
MILYFMLWFSNYAVFLMFTFLIKNHRYGHGADKQKGFTVLVYIFHVLYASAFVGAFIPGYGAACSADISYPYVFHHLIGIDFLLAIVGVVFYVKKLYMRHDYLPIENEGADDPKILSFKKQTKFYTILHMIFASIQVGLISMLGIFVIQNSNHLICIDDGLKWNYNSVFANSFVTFQIIMVILHCAICVNVYYRIPKSFGILEEEKEKQANE